MYYKTLIQYNDKHLIAVQSTLKLYLKEAKNKKAPMDTICSYLHAHIPTKENSPRTYFINLMMLVAEHWPHAEYIDEEKKFISAWFIPDTPKKTSCWDVFRKMSEQDRYLYPQTNPMRIRFINFAIKFIKAELRRREQVAQGFSQE